MAVMWVIKAVAAFLLIWGIWYVCWTVVFAAWDVGSGHAPLAVTVGAIVALLVAGRILERTKRKARSGKSSREERED